MGEGLSENLTPCEREVAVNTARDGEILRRKNTGESYRSIAMDMNLSKQRIGKIIQALTERASPGVPPKTKGFTPREREVALLVERNLPNDEVALTLGINLGTVKFHVHNIFKKLKARDGELDPGPRRWSKEATTVAGRERIREAQRRRWQLWRAARSDVNT